MAECGMNRKERFLKAVQLLAPGDEFILGLAQRVREEQLPAHPGAAALQLVVEAQRLQSVMTRHGHKERALWNAAEGSQNGLSTRVSARLLRSKPSTRG